LVTIAAEAPTIAENEFASEFDGERQAIGVGTDCGNNRRV
jgi:hypothetical protein